MQTKDLITASDEKDGENQEDVITASDEMDGENQERM